MRRKVLLLLYCLFWGFITYGQSQQRRYRDIVFDYIRLQKNVSYRTEPEGVNPKYFLMDVYQPDKDTASKRPLIIWMHGGGFKFGHKKAGGTPIWAKAFAGRGYICAAINYRLNKEKPLTDYKALVQQCMLAIEDLQHVVSFFKTHHEKYRLDTGCIILAGNSAGGMIALQAVYSNAAELAARVSNQNPVNNYPADHNPMNIKAVVSFWGALFDINWLNNANVPLALVHGRKDKIVPATTTADSLFFGGLSVHQEADKRGINNRLKLYNNYAHELQRFFIPVMFKEPVKRRWEEAGKFAADFLYEQLFKK